MKIIKSITLIPGAFHCAVGNKYHIVLSDNSELDEYWEFLYIKYRHLIKEDETVEGWDPCTLVNQSWIEEIN